jgi:hypothetical protein
VDGAVLLPGQVESAAGAQVDFGARVAEPAAEMLGLGQQRPDALDGCGDDGLAFDLLGNHRCLRCVGWIRCHPEVTPSSRPDATLWLHVVQARDMYSPERVSTLTLSPMSTKSGTLIVAPVSSVAGLVPPPEAVSPRRPGSVWETSSSTEAGSCRSLGCRR